MMTGLVCREAAALGISTPICQAITDTISAIDRGERMPGVDNLADILTKILTRKRILHLVGGLFGLTPEGRRIYASQLLSHLDGT